MKGTEGFPVRVRFDKRGKVRWIGHRDVARAFERAFRIEALPLAFSKGFNPHPKVSFGLALSTGFESEAEYLDVEFAILVGLEDLPARLTAALPEGMSVTGMVPLPSRAPALQEETTLVAYRVEVVLPTGAELELATLATMVTKALSRESLPVRQRRKGREAMHDIRPAIRRIDVVGLGDHGVVCEMELCTHPRGVKPDEVFSAITAVDPASEQFVAGHVVRTHQWIERDGTRHEPLEAGARFHAQELCAS